jgi:alpha-tubulin suppressor-like RCC1 family protein
VRASPPALRPARAAAIVAALFAATTCERATTAPAEDSLDPYTDISGEWAVNIFPRAVGELNPPYAFGSIFLSGGPDTLTGPAYLDGDSALAAASSITCLKNGALLDCTLGSYRLTGGVYRGWYVTLHGDMHGGSTSGVWYAYGAASPARLFVGPGTRTIVAGAPLEILARVTDANGFLLGRPLAVATSDQAVASVTTRRQRVVVTGDPAHPGTATITVRAGDLSADVAVRNAGLVRFTAVSAGGVHTCATTSAGPAFCWGSDYAGQRGDSTFEASFVPSGVRADVVWSAVSARSGRTCGLTSAGAVWCWGQASGVLPEPVLGGPTFAAVSAGESHTCALTPAGAAWCWGYNVFGQTGLGNLDEVGSPFPVVGGLTFTAISAGMVHTCAIAADSTGWCWGDNRSGELGTGSLLTTGVTAPIRVVDSLRLTAVTTGMEYTCALAADSTAWCWGANDRGQLGTGDSTASPGPVPVAGGLRFTAISTGRSATCAVAADGSAWCWGWFFSDADGSGSGSATPTPVGGGVRFASVSAGETHACGIATDGVLWCWGYDGSGQLGDGATGRTRPTPVRVAGQP